MRLSVKIIEAGLIVGTLDILSAFTYYFIKTGDKNVFTVLKFVASGFFGKTAFSGGNTMLLAGLIFHYFIAVSFTTFFFLMYPTKKDLFARNKILTGVLYGIFAWCVMNLIVVPMSNIASRPFNLVNAIINMLILIVCIGIPLSIMAANFYAKRISPNNDNPETNENTSAYSSSF